MAYLTIEGASTIVVYGKHFFFFFFLIFFDHYTGNHLLSKLNIFAEGKCGKNLSHQHQAIFKIWDMLTC